MRITKVDIVKETENKDGLEDIKMDRLGPVVLLAGKNGAGKTRILNKVFETFKKKPNDTQLKKIESTIDAHKHGILSFENAIRFQENLLLATEDVEERSHIERAISTYKSGITTNQSQLDILTKKMNYNEIETNSMDCDFLSIPFVPKELKISDSNSYTKHQLKNQAANINQIGIAQLSNASFAKIQFVQDQWFNATHQNSKIGSDQKTLAISEYDKLTSLIRIFLNTNIERNVDGEATLFDFPLGKSNLSDGQKILLQFCMAIFSQEAELKDIILILDEPENHLHPSVIIEIIERIRNCNIDGQIWIATHSIPLLAHFDPSFIWFVEEGRISHAGKIPEKVLSSLLGDEGEIARLRDFISLPAQLASSRYAFESLLEPQVLTTNANDPQSVQIKTELLKRAINGKLRVLEFGAGQGRLISNVFDLMQTDSADLINKLDYIAYDKFDKNKEHCENAIKRVYGTSERRYYNDISTLLSHYDKRSFNVVIMCNVLHEIDPAEWLKLFSKDGVISSLLSDNGILLLVEDHQIPVGEKAYQKGFLVLDTPQIKELFSITEQDTEFTFSDQKGDGRLKAHQIPKECLVRITEYSRLAAIKSLSVVAREKILDIRDREQNYQNGKLHGFWTQQFANAQLNISQLSNS